MVSLWYSSLTSKVRAECSLWVWTYAYSIHTSSNTQIKTGFLGLKLDFNLIPYLHSSSNNLQWISSEGGTFYFVHKKHTRSSFSCMHESDRSSVCWCLLIWKHVPFLKSLFCNTVTLWFQPSEEWKRRKKQGHMLLLFSHLFLYFYFQVAVKGAS